MTSGAHTLLDGTVKAGSTQVLSAQEERNGVTNLTNASSAAHMLKFWVVT